MRIQANDHIQSAETFQGKEHRASRLVVESSALGAMRCDYLEAAKLCATYKYPEFAVARRRRVNGAQSMMCSETTTENKLCEQCGGTIEEGRLPNQPPTEAKYCLRCRSGRRRCANLKYVWKPEYDEYLRAHYHGGIIWVFLVV